MNDSLRHILQMLSERRGIDFSSYREAFLREQVQKRLEAAGLSTPDEYAAFLTSHPDEMPHLIRGILVNYSEFFRSPLVYAMLRDNVLPHLVRMKRTANNRTLRIWSAGCATGKEPYSLAMLLREWLEHEEEQWRVDIFATDIDEQGLEAARKAVYSEHDIQHLPYSMVKKYFTQQGTSFTVVPGITQMVSFSVHDLLDQTSYVPSESIFGNFDLAFCRNVLLYLQRDAQYLVCEKLSRALSASGILVLGESERIPESYRNRFTQICPFCRIYRRNS